MTRPFRTLIAARAAGDVSVLPFIQAEFTHAIGIPPGTYAAAGGDSLVSEIVDTVAATGRARPEPAAPPPVPLAVVTLVWASRRLADAEAGRESLARWTADPAVQDELVAELLTVLNRAASAYRAAARDPYISDLTALDARAVRLGYGHPGRFGYGEGVEAIALTPTRDGDGNGDLTVEQLRVIEAVGAALDGTAVPFEAEELALRAHLDHAHGRHAAAEAQALAAVALLRDELRARGWASAADAVTVPPALDADAVAAVADHVLETAAAYRRAELADREARPES